MDWLNFDMISFLAGLIASLLGLFATIYWRGRSPKLFWGITSSNPLVDVSSIPHTVELRVDGQVTVEPWVSVIFIKNRGRGPLGTKDFEENLIAFKLSGLAAETNLVVQLLEGEGPITTQADADGDWTVSEMTPQVLSRLHSKSLLKSRGAVRDHVVAF